MNVLPRRIKSGASPQPVFNCLRLPYAKGTLWFCGGVEEIGVHFQQQSVTGSTPRREIGIRTITNRFAASCCHETGSGARSKCLKSSRYRSSSCVTKPVPLPQFNPIESSIDPTLI